MTRHGFRASGQRSNPQLKGQTLNSKRPNPLDSTPWPRSLAKAACSERCSQGRELNETASGETGSFRPVSPHPRKTPSRTIVPRNDSPGRERLAPPFDRD